MYVSSLCRAFGRASRRALGLSSILIFAAATIASAQQTIYEDTFPLSGTSSALNLSAPTTASGLAGGTTGVSWKSVGWTKTGTSTAVSLAGGNCADAYLPFTPLPGYVYTLTADLTSMSASGWVALGFLNMENPATSPFNIFFDNEASDWIYFRGPSNQVAGFAGPYSANNYAGAICSGPGKFTVVLDTTGTAWVARFTAPGLPQYSRTYTTNPTITGVGFGGALAGDYTVSNFKLTGTKTAAFTFSDLTTGYAWKPLKIGGGGWVVGMDVSPSAMYARTDVSGAYRWDPATSTWMQLVTQSSMPPGLVGFGMYAGVDSIVAAPSAPNVAYMAFKGEIFSSTNQGGKWQTAGFAAKAVHMNANTEGGRTCGERLAVDPKSRYVVYYGSSRNGLWQTLNGGAGSSWTQITALPTGTQDFGVTSIKIDEASGVAANGATKMVYATIAGQGVYQSTNGGVGWTRISDSGPGSSLRPVDAALGTDRTYYVCYAKTGTLSGAVWRYSSGTWANITPQPNWDYQAVAVDPNDPNRVTVARTGGTSWTSHSRGDAGTWQTASWIWGASDISWQQTQDPKWMTIGHLAYDPNQPGRLWLAEGFGVRSTDSAPGSQVVWTSRSHGIEETLGNDVICPPGGKPVTAMWDVGTFYHTDPDSYDADRGKLTFMSAWSLDWTPATAGRIAAVFCDHREYVANGEESGYSDDGGRTWTEFTTHPALKGYGAIACAANDKNRMVRVLANGTLPYYTVNSGTTWSQGTLSGGATNTGFYYYNYAIKPLAADRVAANTFYLYVQGSGTAAGIYRTTDAGATWARRGPNPANKSNVILKATPGFSGDLWFAEGVGGGGLWRSTNGGTNWKSIEGLDKVISVGFGKPETGTYPTVYAAGTAGTTSGVWRSVDKGVTWSLVSKYPMGIFDNIEAIDGDKEVFGKVYLGFGSIGFAYGMPVGP